MDATVPPFVFILVGWEQVGTPSSRSLCSLVSVNLIFVNPSFSFNEETALAVEKEEVSPGIVSYSYRTAEWGGFYTATWISLHGPSVICVWCLLFFRKIRIRKRAKMKNVALKWPLQRTAPPQGWWTCTVSGRRSDSVPLLHCCERVNQQPQILHCSNVWTWIKVKTASDTHLVPWTSLHGCTYSCLNAIYIWAMSVREKTC